VSYFCYVSKNKNTNNSLIVYDIGTVARGASEAPRSEDIHGDVKA
jgi:hypothetical protein